MNVKYAIGLWLFGQLSDRFLTYHPPKSLEERAEEASKVDGASGVEVIYPMEFKYDELDKVKSLLKEKGLAVASIIPDLFTELRWIRGTLASKDEKTRKEAIKLCIEAIEAAKELGCKTINIWPGQDGYDYPLQADYGKLWDWFVEGVREIASHDSNIRVAVEYKVKEPRTHLLISSVGKALLLVEDVGLKNVGVTLDIGHALQAGENPAESLVLLQKRGKLFHLHANDNYRDWDHDLLSASINFWDYIEIFFWLKKLNYEGWISIDVYPFRENVRRICEESIRMMKCVERLVDKIGMSELEKCIEVGDPAETAVVLRKAFE